jgi:hypothetical protein
VGWGVSRVVFWKYTYTVRKNRILGWGGRGKETHCGKYTDTVRKNMRREGEGGCEIDEQPGKYTYIGV